MPKPEGYRKAQRLMRMAEKFSMPVVTLIDTPGAYPGVGAEERGQSEAIAYSLFLMAGLRTPIISVVIGEGGSGGALAIAARQHVGTKGYVLGLDISAPLIGVGRDKAAALLKGNRLEEALALIETWRNTIPDDERAVLASAELAAAISPSLSNVWIGVGSPQRSCSPSASS